MRNVILVHGNWHGSWCWSLVTAQLAARGVSSVAVDLDGFGLKSRSPYARWGRPFDAAAFATEKSPTADVTASSAAGTLVDQIRLVSGGEPCVVVAHSMGGAVATAAAELAPELFAELVYLTAFAPVTGLPAAAYIGMPEFAGSQVGALLAADPDAVGTLRIDTGDRHAAVRACLYGDVDQDTADAAIALLSPDASFGIATEVLTITPARYGRIPHSYIVCTGDNAIPAAAQRRFVGEIDAVSAAPTTVVEMTTSHSPFLSRPGELADVIAASHRGALARG
jgi:pimeloyl-ACP methyl ester carboxylesterase